MELPRLLAQVLAFAAGVVVTILTLRSAVRTLVLPRAAHDSMSRVVFAIVRGLFHLRVRRVRSFADRDAVLAFYAPAALLLLPFAWLTLVAVGFSLMDWATGSKDLWVAFKQSGSSLLTLGFAAPVGVAQVLLTFTEGALGLVLVALLIAYLPTIYAAFARREAAVTRLEVRAGAPPLASAVITRLAATGDLESLREEWRRWEEWFVDIEESHTSLPFLVYFRSPQPGRSWVTAAGCVLDAASLALAAVDAGASAHASLCVQAGAMSLGRIAGYFGVRQEADGSISEEVSVTRGEFNETLADLEAAGVPLKADRDTAWREWCRWRATYDVPLLRLADITMAPYAPWSSDRNLRGAGPRLKRRDRQ